MANNLSPLAKFTHQFSLSKTLRFELKPVGQTADWIKQHDIIGKEQNELKGKDAIRAQNYKYLKKLLDELHRVFIEACFVKISDESSESLTQVINEIHNEKELNDTHHKSISKTLKTVYDQTMANWIEAYKIEMPKYWKEDIEELKIKLTQTTEKKDIKFLQSLIKKLEKKIKECKFGKESGDAITSNTECLQLLEWKIRNGEVKATGEELAINESTEFLPQNVLKNIIRSFDGFSTYLSGFNENRSNVYALNNKKFIATSIACRTFEQNLLFHLENITRWQKITASLDKHATKLTEQNYDWKQKLAKIESDLNFDINYLMTPNSFINHLSQSGINAYNSFLGGLPEKEGQQKIQGLNEFINLTRQQAGAKRNEFPNMQVLYKQILSKSNARFIDAFSSDEEMLLAVKTFHYDYFTKKDDYDHTVEQNFRKELKELLCSLNEEAESVFIAVDKLNTISQQLTGSWHAITDWILASVDEKQVEQIKKKKAFSVHELETFFAQIHDDKTFSETYDLPPNEIISTFINNRIGVIFETISEKWKDLQKSGILELKELDKGRERGSSGFEQIATIKTFMDAAMELNYFLRNFLFNKEVKTEKFADWYSFLQQSIDDFPVYNLYNKIRNYVSKKGYSEEKLKLNFEKSTLLDGWDRNKETQNLGTLFEKDGCFYLGIMTTESNTIFDYDLTPGLKGKKLEACQKIRSQALADDTEPAFRKVNYKQIADVTTIIPKCSTQLKSVKSHFSKFSNNFTLHDESKFLKKCHITKEVYKLNNYGYDPDTHEFKLLQKGDKFPKKFQKGYLDLTGDHEGFREAMNTWINFCRDFLSSYLSTSIYDFQLKDNDSYSSLDEFYNELNSKTYRLSFDRIKTSYIQDKIAKGELYLFQIYNKDFSKNKQGKGKDNLHTTYWKMAFDEENLADTVVKLNGMAEVFYRPASVTWSEEKMKSGHHAEKLKGKFNYPIIKDKRFTEDKFFFHCPITLNAKAPSSPGRFNSKINEFLANNPDVNIIGIDRGEKHLLYYSVINQKEEILEQGTLNTIDSSYEKEGKIVPHSTDYIKVLKEKEGSRDDARKSWGTIENIKEVKAGYLSHVVHKLSKLIIKHNAIVVLEDLNTGFKRGRFKVERQVYQKFEKALIDKLNYLVFKDSETHQPGHVLNAYQLTNKFESFQKLGKQSGILFYTTAQYTSTTDPVTGFLKNIYKRYANVADSQQFWESFDQINYNAAEDRFEFTYSIDQIRHKNLETDHADYDISVKQWTVCSCVTRSRYIKPKSTEAQKQQVTSEQIGNKGMHETYLVTDKIKEALTKAGINYQNNLDLKPQLMTHNAASLHKDMLYFLNAILTMRVTDSKFESGTPENDYILSPVEPFFDSRKALPTQPENGDANGAYNIARKGICMLKNIANPDSKGKVDLLITKQQWQNYAQKR